MSEFLFPVCVRHKRLKFSYAALRISKKGCEKQSIVISVFHSPSLIAAA